RWGRRELCASEQDAGVEAVREPVGKAVEGHDRSRRDVAVEPQVERQMQRRAPQVGPQPERAGPPRDHPEEREQLIRVQHEHRPLRTSLDVVAEKRVGCQAAIALEEDVIDGVIEIDQKSTGGDRCGGCPRPGEHCGPGARDGGGDEVPSRTHTPTLRNAHAAPKSRFCAWSTARPGHPRARNETAISGPTTRAIYSASGAISPPEEG